MEVQNLLHEQPDPCCLYCAKQAPTSHKADLRLRIDIRMHPSTLPGLLGAVGVIGTCTGTLGGPKIQEAMK